MEDMRTGIAWPTAVAVLMCSALIMLPQVSATRHIVGANMGWTLEVNYTTWAQAKNFYNGDWLFFVYDRNQFNVLEVNRTDYETCNSDSPMHNWTLGAGRDVVPLNVTRPYYFISGKGFCSRGMKVAINVENRSPVPSYSSSRSPAPSPSQLMSDSIRPPAPSPLMSNPSKPTSPSSSPVNIDSPRARAPSSPLSSPMESDSSRFTLRSQIVIPILFLITLLLI